MFAKAKKKPRNVLQLDRKATTTPPTSRNTPPMPPTSEGHGDALKNDMKATKEIFLYHAENTDAMQCHERGTAIKDAQLKLQGEILASFASMQGDLATLSKGHNMSQAMVSCAPEELSA